MSAARLDRCPFCGKKVTIGSMSDDDGRWFFIHGFYRDDEYCHCRVSMKSEKYGDGATDDEIKAIKKALIEKWNRRV